MYGLFKVNSIIGISMYVMCDGLALVCCRISSIPAAYHYRNAANNPSHEG